MTARQKPATTPLAFMNLFPEFRAKSWDAWRGILARLGPNVREFFAICGRGSGKSRIVALLATCFAARHYPRVSGERIYVGIFSPDKKQSSITYRYIVGLMRSQPQLAALIEGQTKDSLTLSNGVVVEVLSATVSSPRGRAYALVIIEEASFLPQDQSANPDVELMRAIRPALARVPGSLLCVVSSPYARRGVLWTAWQKYHEQSPADILLVQQPTAALNPLFDTRAIAQALEDDPASASSEYLAQFRSDIEQFITREAIDACVVPGRLELPRVGRHRYMGFLDFAGGSGQDSATLAVSHEEARGEHAIAVLDAVREVRPPFSPEQVCADFAAVLKGYGIVAAIADRWGGDFPVEVMRRHGVSVFPSERSKSDIYREFLAPLNSGRIELLDNVRLHAQLAGLERRTARGGKDSIDHGPGQHDDVANACAGACVEALGTTVHAGGVGQVDVDQDPYDGSYAATRLSLEDAEKELARRQAARAVARRPTDAGPETPLVRWVSMPREEEDPGGTLVEFDPFRSES